MTSFRVLSRLTLHGEGGKILGSFVSTQGNVEYFRAGHLPYAIPAVFVLVIFSLPPPLLLFSYPLLWRIKARCRCNKPLGTDDDVTVWPIRKLLPLIDSFQGDFRDNRRMFAGLLFLWRVIITAIFAFSTDLPSYFLQTELALLSFFTIHAVVRPYKRQLYNMVDVVMLANIAIINALSWYISVSGNSQAREAAVAVKLIFMYLPIFCVGVTITFMLLQKLGIWQEQVWFHSNEEEERRSVDTAIPRTTQRRITMKERHDMCADEDLFSRAAEPNTPSLVLSGREAGFELQATETTIITTTTSETHDKVYINNMQILQNNYTYLLTHTSCRRYIVLSS